jgi:hypothetical protein
MWCKLLKLLIVATLFTACAAEGIDETWLDPRFPDWEPTPLAANETIVREADPDDGSPGWFPERGEVRVRTAEPGEVPSLRVIGLRPDGKETVAYYGADGKIWEPETTATDKAQVGLWDCWRNGEGHRCPCVRDTASVWPRDVYGNDVWTHPNGKSYCIVPDNESISYNYIRPRNGREERGDRVQGGFHVDFADEITYLAQTTWLPSGYSLFQKTSHVSSGVLADGYYSNSQWGARTFWYPSEPLNYQPATDVLIRKARVYDSCKGQGQNGGTVAQWYDSCGDADGAQLMGNTQQKLQQGGDPHGDVFGGPTAPVGPSSIFNDVQVHVWKPCAVCPWIDYLTIVGAIVTVNQDFILEMQDPGDPRAIEHTVCHELGHALGLPHSSLGQGATCMAGSFQWGGAVNGGWGQTGSLGEWNASLLLYNARHDVSQFMTFQSQKCGFWGGAAACINGVRPPFGGQIGSPGWER